MAHRVSGAPLVYFTLMVHQHMVCHCYIAMAHHMSGAPLVAIPSIALFLVVYTSQNTWKLRMFETEFVPISCGWSLKKCSTSRKNFEPGGLKLQSI